MRYKCHFCVFIFSGQYSTDQGRDKIYSQIKNLIQCKGAIFFNIKVVRSRKLDLRQNR